MTALGPILVATDFSVNARHAADRAARLAHETHSTLTLLHVLPGEPLAQIRDWLGESSAPERKTARRGAWPACANSHRRSLAIGMSR